MLHGRVINAPVPCRRAIHFQGGRRTVPSRLTPERLADLLDRAVTAQARCQEMREKARQMREKTRAMRCAPISLGGAVIRAEMPTYHHTGDNGTISPLGQQKKCLMVPETRSRVSWHASRCTVGTCDLCRA